MSNPKPGHSLDDFRQKHDKGYIVPKKIKEALKELGQSWVYEAEFMRLAGISSTDLSTYREEFVDDHVVVVDRTKRVWCGTKGFAEKLREMVP